MKTKNHWVSRLVAFCKGKTVQTILLDFDGTCVVHAYPHVGRDIGAQQVLRDLVSNGHRLILFTMRSPKNHLDEALHWFEKNSIALYGIQTHPEQHTWTDSPKAYGNIIIDDTMLGAQLVDEAYLNWHWASSMLLQRGLISPAQFEAYDFNADL